MTREKIRTKLLGSSVERLELTLKKEDISTNHRLPSKVKANGERALFPPAIIVKFKSRDVREKLDRAKKVLKEHNIARLRLFQGE